MADPFVLQVAVTKGGGGIVTAVVHYNRMFRRAGVSSACLYRGPVAADLRSEDVAVVAAPRSMTLPFGHLFPDMRAIRADILRRAGGAPLVAIIHSDLALPVIRGLFRDAVTVAPCHSDKFARKKSADIVLTLNTLQHDAISAGLRGCKARAVMLGNPFVSTRADAEPTSEGAPRINFCARFTEVKNPRLLLEAAKLIPSATQFRFIGEGELGDEIRAATAGSANIVCLPWRSDPFADFHRGDILVLPSLWEGLPYAVQEALSLGIPVIASNNAGNRAALGDGLYGSLFPSGDTAALARCIEGATAALAPLRARAAAGRKTLRERYGAEAFWKQLKRCTEEASRNRLAPAVSPQDA
jgi:glycosyltransferase involved in cell wall biosynthesis